MNIQYAVLKLVGTLEVTDSFGVTNEVDIGGCAGYIPVFDTESEAKIAAQDGKYKIAAITTSDTDQ